MLAHDKCAALAAAPVIIRYSQLSRLVRVGRNSANEQRRPAELTFRSAWAALTSQIAELSIYATALLRHRILAIFMNVRGRRSLSRSQGRLVVINKGAKVATVLKLARIRPTSHAGSVREVHGIDVHIDREGAIAGRLRGQRAYREELERPS